MRAAQYIYMYHTRTRMCNEYLTTVRHHTHVEARGHLRLTHRLAHGPERTRCPVAVGAPYDRRRYQHWQRWRQLTSRQHRSFALCPHHAAPLDAAVAVLGTGIPCSFLSIKFPLKLSADGWLATALKSSPGAGTSMLRLRPNSIH